MEFQERYRYSFFFLKNKMEILELEIQYLKLFDGIISRLDTIIESIIKLKDRSLEIIQIYIHGERNLNKVTMTHGIISSDPKYMKLDSQKAKR